MTRFIKSLMNMWSPMSWKNTFALFLSPTQQILVILVSRIVLVCGFPVFSVRVSRTFLKPFPISWQTNKHLMPMANKKQPLSFLMIKKFMMP